MIERMLERLKIMVVDDNHHMANIVKTILRGFGVKKFLDADTAEEAYQLFLGESIDIIITDYAMDSMDGRELIRLIRNAEDSRNRYVPVIMLSAYSERSKVEAARDAGVNEFCAKPVTAIELYRKIHAIINAPRPYVRTQVYFGPDRRRRASDHYEGDDRRDADAALIDPGGAAEREAPAPTPDKDAEAAPLEQTPHEGAHPDRQTDPGAHN